jgi:hypothetical protein
MKSTKEPTKDFLKKGAIASLSWTQVSRRSGPAAGTVPSGDVVYGIRTSDDIARGFAGRDKSSVRR